MTNSTEPPALSKAKRDLMALMLSGKAPLATREEISRRDPRLTVPMSAAQRQVWLHAQMAPDMPLYNESITIHRRGSFDLGLMDRAVNELLRRHEIWRTGFEMRHGELVQVIIPEIRLTLGVVDVSHLSGEAGHAAAVAIADQDARMAINLDKPPLLRAQVVKMAGDYHRLYLTLHHSIFDGVSIYRIIVPELAQIYASFERGLPSPLPEPVLQYADYAVWQQTELKSPRVMNQLDHWRRTLADLPPKLVLTGTGRRLPCQPMPGRWKCSKYPKN